MSLVMKLGVLLSERGTQETITLQMARDGGATTEGSLRLRRLRGVWFLNWDLPSVEHRFRCESMGFHQSHIERSSKRKFRKIC